MPVPSGSTPTTNNIEFNAPGMSSAYSFSLGECGITNKLTPPLVVTNGSSVKVNIAYDLSNAVGQTGQGCNSDTPAYCFTVPTFTPTATTIIV